MSALAAVIWDWWWALALCGAAIILAFLVDWHRGTPDPTAPEGPAAEPAPAGPTAAEQVAAAALTPDDPALPDLDATTDAALLLITERLVDRYSLYLLARQWDVPAAVLQAHGDAMWAELQGLDRQHVERLLALALLDRAALRARATVRAVDQLDERLPFSTERTDR